MSPLELKPGETEATRSDILDPRPCHACDAPIAWVVTKNGKRMPLSARTARALPCPDCAGAGGACPRCLGVGQLYAVLTHFADCPASRRFSGQSRRASKPDPGGIGSAPS